MKKILMAAVAVVLIVVISVSATFAYLTDSKSVTNTFTVGQVKISLAETVDDSAVKTENGYKFEKIVPGHEYSKKPVITVDASSENCYLFVKVENGIADLEADTKIAAQMTSNGWESLSGVENMYYYNDTAKAGDEVTVFEKFTVRTDIGNNELKTFEGKTIAVTAYAIQADGFDNAADAWSKAGGQFN